MGERQVFPVQTNTIFFFFLPFILYLPCSFRDFSSISTHVLGKTCFSQTVQNARHNPVFFRRFNGDERIADRFRFSQKFVQSHCHFRLIFPEVQAFCTHFFEFFNDAFFTKYRNPFIFKGFTHIRGNCVFHVFCLKKQRFATWRVMLIQHAGAFHLFPFLSARQVFFTIPDDRSDHLACDKPGAQNNGNFARAIANGALDSALTFAAVQNQGYLSLKIVQHVLRRRRADVPRQIGAGRDNGNPHLF